MESDFITWMDRYHREHPGELTPDETDESLMILAKKGIEHEKAFLASLQAEGKDVCVIARRTDAAIPEASSDPDPNPDASQNTNTNPDASPKLKPSPQCFPAAPTSTKPPSATPTPTSTESPTSSSKYPTPHH